MKHLSSALCIVCSRSSKANPSMVQVPFVGDPEDYFWPWNPPYGIGENVNQTRLKMEALNDELLEHVFNDSADGIRRLHALGANIDMKDYTANGSAPTPLMCALANNKTESVKTLLDLGCDVNKVRNTFSFST
jgi:hypothetical protein